LSIEIFENVYVAVNRFSLDIIFDLLSEKKSELTVQHKLLNLGQSTAVIVFTLSGVISIRGMFKRPLVDS
jgi:hypothetical protein